MLGRAEQRQLRELEQQLEGEDPELASRLTGRPPYWQPQAVRPVALALLGINLVGLAMGIWGANAVLACISGALAAFDIWLVCAGSGPHDGGNGL
jgi:hypothetical protein